MIAINGWGSVIAQEFLHLIPSDESAVRMNRGDAEVVADRYLFCQGFLAGRMARDHDGESGGETFAANFLDIAAACDGIFATSPTARVCIIGSDSGFRGSYDTAYAGAKAAMHLYVETKKLLPDQQLVCVAPWIVSDAGMTTRRSDTDRLADIKDAHPKRRFCTSADVARVAHFLLYQDDGYLTGIVIRMHGGAQ